MDRSPVVQLLRGGRWRVLLGRAVVWTALAVVGLLGVRELIAPVPAAAPPPDTADGWQAEAGARAVQVAVEYLAWEPTGAGERRERLAALGDAVAVEGSQVGEVGQRALHAVPGEVRPVGDDRGVVAVAVRVAREPAEDGTAGWLHVDVPVGRVDGRGTVTGSPALVPAPAADPPPAPPITAADPRLAQELTEPLTAFFRAYGGGDAAALDYLVAPGAEVAPLDEVVALQAVQRVQVRDPDGPRRRAVATVRWALAGAELVESYDLDLVYDAGRWRVAALAVHDPTLPDGPDRGSPVDGATDDPTS